MSNSGIAMKNFILNFTILCIAMNVNLISQVSSTNQYSYDNLNRLNSNNYNSKVTTTYTYDNLGNRISKTVQGYRIVTGLLQKFSVCQGANFDVNFTVDNNYFSSGNIFTSQLSDVNGSFNNPVNIGTINSTNSGKITAFIPKNTVAGTKYRVRVIGSSPSYIGSDNIFDITINSLPKPDFTGNYSPCASSNQTYITTDNGTTFQWEVSGGTIIGSNNNNSVNILWGSGSSGIVRLIETMNTTGCKDSTIKSIKINPLPQFPITGNNNVCLNQLSSYTCTDLSDISYSWQVTNGQIVMGNNTHTILVKWNNVGQGTVQVTQTYKSTSCSFTQSFNVTVNPLPTPDFAGNFVVCAKTDNIYTSNSTAGTTNEWIVTGGKISGSNTSNIVTINWNIVTTGKLKLIQTIATTGCKDSIEKVITINSLPTPNFTGDSIVCAKTDGTYQSNSSTGTSDLWMIVSGGTIQGSAISKQLKVLWNNVETGTIRLIQTNTATGCKDSIEKTITIQPLPTPDFNTDFIVCAKTEVTFESNSGTGINNKWSVLEGGIINGSDTSKQVSIIWDTLTTGKIRLLQTNILTGCKDSIDKIINIHSLPTPTIKGEFIVCAETDHVYSTDSINGITNEWKVIDGGSISGSNTEKQVKVIWNSTTSGTLRLTQTITETGCKDSTTKVVNINPLSHPKIQGDSIVCFNNIYRYNVQTDSNLQNQWQILGGKLIKIVDSNTVDIQWNKLDSVSIKVIQTNKITSCVDSTLLNVWVNPLPQPLIVGDSISCEKEIKTYTASKNNGKNEWFVSGGMISDSLSDKMIRISWLNVDSASVKLIQTNEFGCTDSITLKVKVNPIPKPEILGLTSVCEKSEGNYQAKDTIGLNSKWSVIGGQIMGDSLSSNITVKWIDSVYASVKLIQENTVTGCVDSIIKEITLNKLPQPQIFGDSNVCEKNYYKYHTNLDNSLTNEWKITNGQVIDSSSNYEIGVIWNSSIDGKIKLITTNTITGCKDSTEKIITINKLPIPTISGNSVVCAKDTTSYKTLKNNNEILWKVDGGNIQGSAKDSTVNIYWTKDTTAKLTLVQTTKAGCIDSVSINILVNPLPDMTIIGDTSVCVNHEYNYLLLNQTGYNNKWSVSKGKIVGNSTSNSLSVNWDTIGNGYIKLSRENIITGCKDSVTQYIYIYSMPKANFTGDTIVCANSIIDYVASQPSAEYNWVITGGNVIGDSNLFKIQIKWGTTNYGTIKLVQKSSIQCIDFIQKNIAINPLPKIALIGDTIVCDRNIYEYSTYDDNGITNSWEVTNGNKIDSNSTNSTIKVKWNSNDTGKIKITRKDLNTLCENTITESIIINKFPLPKIFGDSCACLNNVLKYSSNTGFKILWEVVGGNIIGSNTDTIVNVIWTTPNNCLLRLIEENKAGCKDTLVKNIDIIPKVKIVGDTLVCKNQIYEYSTDIEIDYNFKWILLGGKIIDSNNTNTVIHVIWNDNASGQLTLTKITKNSICQNSLTKNIIINTNAKSEILGDSIVCLNKFTIYSTNSNIIDHWEISGGNIIGTNNDKTVLVQWTDSYNDIIKLIQKSNLGCQDTTLKLIKVFHSPKLDFQGDYVACINDIKKYVIYNPNDTIDYNWEVTNGTVINNDKNSIKINWNIVGDSYIKLIQTNKYSGCTDTVTKYITVFSKPSTTLSGELSVCENNIYTYKAEFKDGINYTWEISGGDTIALNRNEATILWRPGTIGTLKLVVSTQFTDCKDSITQMITINSLPVFNLIGDTIVCINKSYEYYIDNKLKNINWDVFGGSIISSNNVDSINIKWNKNGFIKAIGSNDNNCIDSIIKNIAISDKYLTVSLDSITGYIGDTVQLQMIISKPAALVINDDFVIANLYYNPKMLEPLGYIGTNLNDSTSYIQVLLPIPKNKNLEKFTVNFQVFLGSTISCPLIISDISQFNDLCFNITDGGFKYNSTGILNRNVKLIVFPIPSTGYIVCNIELVEDGRTKLYFIDMLGNIVLTAVDKDLNLGFYKFPLTVYNLPQGTYYIVLETPTTFKTVKIVIVK